MAFVREKKSRGRTYLYLVENERNGRTVKQRVIAYLGPVGEVGRTVEAALTYWRAELDRLCARSARNKQEAEIWRAKVHPAWIERNGGEVPKGGGRGRQYRYDVCAHYWHCVKWAQRDDYRAVEARARIDRLTPYVEEAMNEHV